MSQLGFEPVFDSYVAVGLIALALLALLAIRPQFGSLSRRRKTTLLALRLTIVLLAIAALLRPTWITTVRNPAGLRKPATTGCGNCHSRQDPPAGA